MLIRLPLQRFGLPDGSIFVGIPVLSMVSSFAMTGPVFPHDQGVATMVRAEGTKTAKLARQPGADVLPATVGHWGFHRNN